MTQNWFGLGLTIVKSIIDAHGCDIMLESELGKGSKMIVVLNAEKEL